MPKNCFMLNVCSTTLTFIAGDQHGTFPGELFNERLTPELAILIDADNASVNHLDRCCLEIARSGLVAFDARMVIDAPTIKQRVWLRSIDPVHLAHLQMRLRMYHESSCALSNADIAKLLPTVKF